AGLRDGVLGVVARVGFVRAESHDLLDDLFLGDTAAESALGVGPVALRLSDGAVARACGLLRIRAGARGHVGGFLLAGWEALRRRGLVRQLFGADVVGLLIFVVIKAGEAQDASAVGGGGIGAGLAGQAALQILSLVLRESLGLPDDLIFGRR